MTRHPYDPTCPDCRPCILDIHTMQPIPDNDPRMLAIMAAWEEQPYDVREAFINLTVHNQIDQATMERAQSFCVLIGPLLAKKGNPSDAKT